MDRTSYRGWLEYSRYFESLHLQFNYYINVYALGLLRNLFEHLVKNNIPVHSALCVSWKQTNDVIDM